MAGKGREIADAYIEVHGDLTKFRNSLNKAAKAGAAAGKENATSFWKGWEARSEKEVLSRWDSVMDALYSKKSVDWDRLINKFNPDDLKDAQRQIKVFLNGMQDAVGMTNEQLDGIKREVEGIIKAKREQLQLTEDHGEALQENARRVKQVGQAHYEAVMMNRKIDKDQQAERMAALKELSRAHAEALMINRKMDKDDLAWEKARKAEMVRIHAEALSMNRRMDKDAANFRKAQIKELNRAHGEAIKEGIARNKRFARSFAGMLDAAKTRKMEAEFKRLTTAIATADFSKMAKGHETMEGLRKEITRTAIEMNKLGRMSDTELGEVLSMTRSLRVAQADFAKSVDKSTRRFRPLKLIMDKVKKSWDRMDSTVRVVLGLIAAAAGPMATLGSGLAGAATAMASSLAMAAGSIVPLVGGMTALVAGAVLAAQSFDEIKARLPGIQESLNSISATWAEQVTAFGEAWGPALDNFLNVFAEKFGQFDFGGALGNAFSKITDAFTGVVNSDGFQSFMKAMSTDLPAAAAGLGTGFAGVLEGILNLIAGAGPVAKALGEDFAAWGKNIASALEAARESGALNDIFTKMRESLLVVLDLAGSIGSALGTLFLLGSESGNRMLESLTAIVDSFTAWMQTEAGRATMLEWFANAEAIVRSMEPVVVGLAEALAGLVTERSIAQFKDLMAAVGEILPILGELLGIISELGILNIIAEAFRVVGQAITPLLEPLHSLAQMLGPMIQDAIVALGPLLTKVGEAFRPIIDAVVELVAYIQPVLVPAIQKIVEALTPVIEVITQVVTAILDVLVPVLGPLLVGIINNVVGVIQGIADVFMGVVKVITGLFQGNWTMVWNGIKQIVGGAVQAIWNFIQLWIIGKVVKGIGAALGGIKSLFTNIWNAIKSFVSGAVTGIKNTIAATMKTIQTTIGNILKGIGQVFRNIWNGIKGVVSGAITGIRGIITTIMRGIQSFFSNTWRNIQNTVSGALDRVSSAVRTGINNVVSFVRGLPGKALSALSGIGYKLYSVGSDLIRGFINGVKAMAGNIARAALNAVGNAVNAVKNFLGINSPSKLFIGIGKSTGEGMVVGTDRMKGAVASAATRMANVAVEQFKGSKMKIAGLDAAKGLAEGLRSGGNLVKGAFGGLSPVVSARVAEMGSIKQEPRRASSPTEAATMGRSVVVEPGAISIHTNSKDPKTTAEMVLDDLATHTKMG